MTFSSEEILLLLWCLCVRMASTASLSLICGSSFNAGWLFPDPVLQLCWLYYYWHASVSQGLWSGPYKYFLLLLFEHADQLNVLLCCLSPHFISLFSSTVPCSVFKGNQTPAMFISFFDLHQGGDVYLSDQENNTKFDIFRNWKWKILVMFWNPEGLLTFDLSKIN